MVLVITSHKRLLALRTVSMIRYLMPRSYCDMHLQAIVVAVYFNQQVQDLVMLNTTTMIRVGLRLKWELDTQQFRQMKYIPLLKPEH